MRQYKLMCVLFVQYLLFSCVTLSAKEKTEIMVGAEQFSEYLPLIKNQRVALLVNPTSRVKNQHLVDALLEKQVNITMVFAPEHGFRGEHGAGEMVKDYKDIKTGLKIVSLHGKHKKPQANHLKQIDILIFDIQDVGVRYYTYISSMHYLMEACAENDIPLIVLDRPNPNGDYIDGGILKAEFKSFVGMHAIPIVHGLTVAELALMINGEGWLKDGKQCELTVVKVKNYNHNSRYSLPVKPSPNLPNDLSVRLYPSLGFFEATPVSIGRGTEWPFQVIGYPNKNMGAFNFKPNKIRGSWSQLNHAGDTLYGERINKIELPQGINLNYFLNWSNQFNQQNIDFITREGFLDKLSGSSELRLMLNQEKNAQQIKQLWNAGLKKYQKIRTQYLLYKDSDFILNHF